LIKYYKIKRHKGAPIRSDLVRWAQQMGGYMRVV